MPLEDKQLVALNLPKVSKFAKNGVVITVEEAIDAALESTQVQGANVWQLALAMLLRMLAADYPFYSQSLGPIGYSKPRLLDMASDWETRAAGGTPDTINSVPAVFSDENNCEGFGGVFC